MTNKKSMNVLALLLITTIGLAACNAEETPPQSNSDPENTEVEENVEQTDSDEEDEQSETDEEAVEDEKDEEETTEESVEKDEEDQKETTVFGNQENFVYISADRLTVRADSSEQSETLGSLAKGSEVKVIEEVESEEMSWYKVNYQNSVGWISSEFTVTDMNELHSSPTIFEDEEMNEYFTSPTLFEENTVVAYYGHPNSEVMGIVGRHSVEDLISLLKETADSYDSVDESKGAIPAIYLVYGTVQPGGIVHKMNYDLVMSYIEAAYQSGVLVYIDHQIGKNAPAFAISELLSFMRYPNVHLALDPEWRTDRPMEEVGHLTGTEINEIQETMQEYIVSNDIPGTRQFVFHQFIEKMIRNSEDITSDYDPVLLVHNTSGWGSPEGKRTTHERNAETTNIPYKGFKLWYHYSDDPGVHYDSPLMTPEEVLGLDPQPGLVIYQ